MKIHVYCNRSRPSACLSVRLSFSPSVKSFVLMSVSQSIGFARTSLMQYLTEGVVLIYSMMRA